MTLSENSTEKNHFIISNYTIERERREIEAGFQALGLGRRDKKKIYKREYSSASKREEAAELSQKHKRENIQNCEPALTKQTRSKTC